MHQKDDYLSVDNSEAVHSCTVMKTYQLASIGRVVVIVEKPAMCSEYRVTIKHIEESDKAVQFTPSRLDILFTFLCHYIFFMFNRTTPFPCFNDFVYCWCRRWASFRQLVEEIDLKVKALDTDEIVNFRQHIGGGYFVSVTSGFFCVDFRKFFVPRGQHDVKPTRKGIALRLYEWADMRKVIEDINTDYPDIGTALPCSVQDDHNNQLSAFNCRECYPFGADI